jgi:uncharacterized protein YegJ (DUF2314 family)
MRNVLFIICCLFYVSCNNYNEPKIDEDYSDNISAIYSDDQNMNNAIDNAKKTFGEFDSAFKSNKFDTSTFAIKVRFETDDGGEHIWATSLIIKDGNYFGIIDDLPEVTTKVKQGDRVKITNENLSDWMYSDNGVLRGGFTIKVLRNYMSPEEKKQFDSNFSFRIEDD